MTLPPNDSSMLMASGEYWDFNAEPASQVHKLSLDLVATALAREGRYANQAPRFYSVAEHSLLVAQFLPEELRLAGLLHDAHEAVCKDTPSLYKVAHWDAWCRGYDQRCQLAFLERFGCTGFPASRVHRADMIALALEFLLVWGRPDLCKHVLRREEIKLSPEERQVCRDEIALADPQNMTRPVEWGEVWATHVIGYGGLV